MHLTINEMAKIATSVSKQAGHMLVEMKINHHEKLIVIRTERKGK
jgi:hypothetical protein